MRRSRSGDHARRGVALVETTLTVGVILTLLLFAVQVGVLGFLQVTVDAASFVNARQNAVSVLTLGGPVAATQAIFPQLSKANITTQVLPAPSPSIPVDYGYNSSDANTQAQSVTNRHGGVSMMQPLLQQSTVTAPGIFNFLGHKIGAAGSVTEPFWQECGAHDNVANQPVGCGAANSPANYQVDFFKNGENTPPYYLSLNYIEHCQAAQPWNGACPSGDVNLLALGVAEYLTVNDWTRANPGASGAKATATFSDMACHQRAFDAVAQIFYANPSLEAPSVLPAIYNTYGSTIATEPAGFNDFSQFVGFGATDSKAIQQIYSWDRPVAAGYTPGAGTDPTQYPLDPSNGC